MKTIGLIGGMSWESTAHYYSLLNRAVKARLGGYHSAKLLLYSIDFDELATRQHAEKWDEATAMMVDAAQRLERGGADFVLICANTMHISAREVERSVRVPLLHVADATGQRICTQLAVNGGSQNNRRVGLLGTAFTMERDFYKTRLREKFGFDVLVPNAGQRKLLHDIIFRELVHGVVNPDSKAKLRKVNSALASAGAEGIILGCTELMMIIDPSDSPVPLFDTTTIHCEAAVDFALAEDD
jgi:aspartate racemase